jgi:hypothetical protein
MEGGSETYYDRPLRRVMPFVAVTLSTRHNFLVVTPLVRYDFECVRTYVYDGR